MDGKGFEASGKGIQEPRARGSQALSSCSVRGKRREGGGVSWGRAGPLHSSPGPAVLPSVALIPPGGTVHSTCVPACWDVSSLGVWILISSCV